jgi:membrane fusion protein (multidrug efflux system)
LLKKLDFIDFKSLFSIKNLSFKKKLIIITVFFKVNLFSFIMKNVFIPLLLSFVLFSCENKKDLKQSNGPSKNGPLKVEAIVVKSSTLSNKIEIAGNILPFELTEIRSEISGRIVQINFKEGTYTPKNTILVKLFDGDLQAQLKKLKVQLQIAEKTEERQRELLKISGISQQDYDLSLLQVNNIKADIELIQVSILKTEILAPYAGRIGLRNISLGAYITPSNILTSLSQVDKKKITFSVPEKYSSDIKQGMNIQFTIEGSPNNYTATILASESIIESETRNLKILAVINEADAKLVPGSFAKVSLELGKNDLAVVVPTQAIIPSARSKQLVLFKNGSPEFVNVTTGTRGVENVEITSGIKVGDTVIITGLLFVRKDSKLIISKIQ